MSRFTPEQRKAWSRQRSDEMRARNADTIAAARERDAENRRRVNARIAAATEKMLSEQAAEVESIQKTGKPLPENAPDAPQDDASGAIPAPEESERNDYEPHP